MKKSFTIIALAALVMLAGCKKNDPKPNGTRLIAGIEKHKSDSKTSLDGLQIKWTAGDKLYVYDKDAEEGAIFTLSSGEGTSTGEFTGTYNFTNENVAVYPSSSFSGSGGTIVTMTLPAVQTASGSGSFGNGANPMLGVFSDMDNLTLTSLCGVLCLQLTGNNVHITAIEIVGGPDDKLNGTFTANYKDTDPVLAKSGDDGNNTVRLNCPATLTSTAQKFYVVLPAGTLANGFTMKVYNGTNVIFTKSTTHDITMHLNTIETMDPLHIELWDGNLSTLTGSEPAGYATATNDMTIYGTLAATANNVKVSIADGANVTLQDATINGQGFSSYNYAGLTLLGSANITLVGTSTMSGGVEKAGIYAPVGGTLTISGDGTINATGGEYAAGIGSNYLGSSGNIVITNGSATINATGGYAGAGIGSGYKAASECGNIEITDSFTGTVNATGHYGSPGIGSGNRSSCGSITISGGTINATGEDGGAVGNGAPGIGSGIDGSCGAITINESVTLVTAVKGNSAPCCIGKGSSASCGTINIGGTEYWDGSAYQNGGGAYLTTSPLVYPVPTPVEQIVDLSTITSAYTAVDGDILTGTLGTGVQISIADGATITLRSANINGSDNLSGTFHGLNCLGDATIILENNDNVVKANCGSENGRSGIYVPRYKTLTFEAGNSSGFVVATGSGEAAGIGGYSNNHCGVIVINSGKVTGTAGTGVDETFGDSYSAGIGSSAYKRCGGIIINGGQVIGTAYADGNAAGIGTGGNGICKKEGDTEGSQPAITISNTLSNYVKAQKGSSATYFIGGGTSSKCGIVIVGGTTYEDGGGNRGISSSTSLSYDFTVVGGNSLIYMP